MNVDFHVFRHRLVGHGFTEAEADRAIKIIAEVHGLPTAGQTKKLTIETDLYPVLLTTTVLGGLAALTGAVLALFKVILE